MSLTTSRGVTLPPNSVTPVNFISKLSIDRHKGAYDVAEQVLGDPLEGIVVPEGIYPAKGQNVRVLVANNGTEGKLLLPGQRLEGLAVSRTRGHAKPPSPAPRAAAAQNSEPPDPASRATAVPDGPPEISEMTEPSRMEFSKLLEALEIPENELLKKHPQTRKDLDQLLWEYQDIFSQDTPGCTDKVELDLELKPGTLARGSKT